MLHENILIIRDENGLGNVYHEMEFSFDKVKVSIRDIITERIYQEVEKYNQQAANYKYSLVKPKDDEVRLNNPNNKKRLVNAEKQVEVALNAFNNNGFFLLVDNLQAEDLDHMVEIKPDTSVSFIKLTPLVGG